MKAYELLQFLIATVLSDLSNHRIYLKGVIPLLRNQETLPLLPIPKLEHLLEFLQWIEPIVDREEFQESQEALAEFIMPNGDGEKLQKKLIEVSKSQSSGWLAPLWNDMYLEYRGQLVCNMNYYALLENVNYKSQYTVATLGAKLIYELIREYIEISSKCFHPEFSKDQPLCMDQYNHIFKSVRLPLFKKDMYKTYPFTNQHHIVVYYKNNMYKVETSDSDGNIQTVDKLASKLQRIIDENIEDKGNDIGSLTTATRENASTLYESMEMDSTNRNSLDTLNTAVFVLCIDPITQDLKTSQEMLLLSNGKNRYFDKSCQIILWENLDIGFNNEHTGADATPWFSLINRVFSKIRNEANNEIDLIDTSLPDELEWHIPNELKSRLTDQLNKHQDLVHSIYVDHLMFNHFGKGLIKTEKISPDAFFHIALQIAQYKTFGKLRSTYEAVSIRNFKNGRTECARAVNEDVSTLAIEISSKESAKDRLKELYQNAQDAHVNRIKKCQNGLGIERHLFALYKMYEKYGNQLGISSPPKLYDSPGYKQLKHDFISTSGVGFESIRLFGFGPVVDDGYGIGYVIKDDEINVSLSTKIKNKDKGIELLNNLNDAFLLLMYTVIQ